MNISQLLKKHGKHAHTVPRDCSVVDAVEKMTLTKSGALIVTENDCPVGIFTEHDVFRCHMVDKTGSFSDMKVADVMSRTPIFASPDENIGHALNRMLNAQIHHLPVIESDKISGMLMINDIVRQHMEALNAELQYLHEYISRLQDAGKD
jgi:signal-transduction protein with cAMP-binding, CBS, and nucleotidyltransferase domain